MLLEEQKKSALVVEGGAMRGVFSTGVLDAFLLEQFDPFDLYIGVSSGASNLAAYLANMYQRNYHIFTTYSLASEFINWKRFLLGGHLIDLDWMWEVTMRDIRLDLDTLFLKQKEFVVVVTSVEMVQPLYVEPDAGNCEAYLKASSAIPLFYRHFPQIEGVSLIDGGMADSIPVMEAYRRGARKIMVIRSRHYDYVKHHDLGAKLYRLLLKDYPQLQKRIPQRAADYRAAVDFIRNPPPGVTILEINPPSSFQARRLTRNDQLLKAGYHQGVEAGKTAISQWLAMTP